MRTPVKDFRVNSPDQAETILIGDEVRSYDFADTDDCYVIGVVERIVFEQGCKRYFIRCHISCISGEERAVNRGESVVKPPVNGTKIAGSDKYTNGVRKL